MHEFLNINRDELIRRCEANVAGRARRAATVEQLKNGIPLFVDQLIHTLQAERDDGGTSEIGGAPMAHGRQLLELGYTVNQVVHDYGDLCEAITDLAVERHAPFGVEEFRTLNRCLDNAIADAVSEYSSQKDISVLHAHSAESAERLGFLVHELRNSLQTATLAFTALQSGQLPLAGATGVVLGRSLLALTSLVNRALDDVRAAAGPRLHVGVFSLSSFIAEAGNAAFLDAGTRGCILSVRTVKPDIEVEGDRSQLLGALMNLLQNAFKFTHPGTEVSLSAHAGNDDTAFVDVEDHCGGLPAGAAEVMFRPFTRRHDDRSGLGLGLSISRSNVEASGGTLSVRNVPGTGCVFTIELHQHHAAASP